MGDFMELKDFKLIELSHFDNAKSVDYLSDDAEKLLFLDSPALSVFRDFKKHKALATREDTPLQDVKKKLIDNYKDFVLVTDSSNQVTGTIALHYLEGQALQERANDEGIKVSDMVANDAKLHISSVNTVTYSTIESVKIGHILHTLINSTYHHIVAYDTDEKGHEYIRGYFSLAFIRRELGIDIRHIYRKNDLAGINRGL
ncbi:MAG: signal-transduction protein with cAMP-binding, CBS, and nucleotidyltransferase domain [Francisella sp.]|jgi:hypothetical protein